MDNKLQTLNYSIYNFSSFSSSYLPENIRDNSPNNQISRWSSETNTPTQFITLKLVKPSIVKYIKFGKYEKPHVCNLKKFRVLGGMDINNMSQMFEGGLKNDSIPEVFELKCKALYENEDFPVLFIQVIPLLSYGPSFNFSIWYIELLGLEDDFIVSNVLQQYNEAKEKTTIRLILKHLRNKGYLEAFHALSGETNIQLEDEEITELYRCLVDDGDFKKVENIMEKLVNEGNIDEYIAKQKYKATYKELNTESDNNGNRPKSRNNAAYTFDRNRQLIYMFGGSDETNELNDFWVFDLKKNEWSEIESENGPSPRIGSKMVFDTDGNQLFVIGRKSSKGNENFRSDFYLYDVSRNSWILICEDTSLENGPHVVSDHQMCISHELRTIYIFGGKLTNRPDDNADVYSDFYAYHINTNTWNKLFVDTAHPLAANPDIQSVKSRINHSMLYDDRCRKIYIFGGQRGKENCSDFLKYNVDTHTLTSVQTTITEADAAGQSIFTGILIASIDMQKGEIFALMRDCLWLFSLATSEWSMIYKNAMNSCPEYFVFDSIAKKHFVLSSGSEFCLELSRPSRDFIFGYCKYLIRKQHYEEITRTNAIDALRFLRTNLAETINKSDIDQVNDFHKLASLLFCNQVDDNSLQTEDTQDRTKVRNQRTLLFNKLIELLPEIKCQPRPNLCNFINN
ncbi:CLUMA_CG009303, isoform A [Clunio marinus]|uniref:CLUMA_CG009303, isoform A n=1 Tax=Clunio marinus TaxID=568069 RepID=A0A1J1I6G7_9DIPT|nr:CLUMA_CG009303, isoform A [Clunio marinus]